MIHKQLICHNCKRTRPVRVVYSKMEITQIGPEGETLIRERNAGSARYECIGCGATPNRAPAFEPSDIRYILEKVKEARS